MSVTFKLVFDHSDLLVALGFQVFIIVLLLFFHSDLLVIMPALVFMVLLAFDHNEAIILLVGSLIIFVSTFYHNHNDLQVAMVPSPQQVPPSQAVSVRIGW